MKIAWKKSVVSMMVLGMAVSGAAGVYAGTNLEKINAYLNHGLGIQVNGAAFASADAQSGQVTPITYKDTTYLPVRAIAEALHIPIQYDAQHQQIQIGTAAAPVSGELAAVTYSAAQVADIKKAFAGFESFETAYAPTKMTSGDAYAKVGGTDDDGVNLVFAHMIVNVSPRDYSYEYEGTTVTLSNGVQGKWYTPSETAMLSFKLDDRTVTISSPDGKLSKAEIEKVAVGVAKLN